MKTRPNLSFLALLLASSVLAVALARPIDKAEFGDDENNEDDHYEDYVIVPKYDLDQLPDQNYDEKSDLKKALAEAKSNKISVLLHYIKQKTEKAAYKPKKPAVHYDFEGKSDEEVLLSLCTPTFNSLCRRIVRNSFKKNPEKMAALAMTVREKPQEAEAKKLVLHKLFEQAVQRMEAHDYDIAVDAAINLVAKRNPYVYVANKAINMAVDYGVDDDKFKTNTEMITTEKPNTSRWLG